MLAGKPNMEAGKQCKQYPIIRTMPQEYIPWDILVPHTNQVLQNHSQTLERLAERGGLSWLEVLWILEDKAWGGPPGLTTNEAKRIVLEHVAAWALEQQGV